MPASVEAIASRLEAIASRLATIAVMLEAIAVRLEAIAVRLEAIATRVEAIATRVEAIAIRCFFLKQNLWNAGLLEYWRSVARSHIEHNDSEDSKCTAPDAISASLVAMTTAPKKHVVLSDSCSAACEAVNDAIRQFNVLQARQNHGVLREKCGHKKLVETKKLLETSASLVVTSALLLVTRTLVVTRSSQRSISGIATSPERSDACYEMELALLTSSS